MKYPFLSLFFILILSTIVRADIETAKDQCKDLGFTPGTEKYGDCVLKFSPRVEKGINPYTQLPKVEENVANSLKFKEATYVGEVKKGKAHGVGVFTFSDGSIYEGKVSKNKIHGKGKYIDSIGKVYEGNFKYGALYIKINKRTRTVLKIKPKTGLETYAEMKGTGSASTKWFKAKKNSSGDYELTAEGKLEMVAAKNSSSGNSSGGSKGGC